MNNSHSTDIFYIFSLLFLFFFWVIFLLFFSLFSVKYNEPYLNITIICGNSLSYQPISFSPVSSYIFIFACTSASFWIKPFSINKRGSRNIGKFGPSLINIYGQDLWDQLLSCKPQDSTGRYKKVIPPKAKSKFVHS